MKNVLFYKIKYLRKKLPTKAPTSFFSILVSNNLQNISSLPEIIILEFYLSAKQIELISFSCALISSFNLFFSRSKILI